LDQQKHPHTFASAARRFLEHQASQITAGDIDARNQYEDRKKLNKDILPYFRTMDVSQITKQTINEYLASLNNRHLSKSTRNKHIGVIRKVLTQACDVGILKTLPIFPKIGQNANPRACFDRNEYKLLRDTAKKYAEEKYVAHAFVKGQSVRRLVFTDEFYDFLIFAVNGLCGYPISNYFRISTSRLLKDQKSLAWQFVRLSQRPQTERQ
jgi:Phage integrase SAM-like domain